MLEMLDRRPGFSEAGPGGLRTYNRVECIEPEPISPGDPRRLHDYDRSSRAFAAALNRKAAYIAQPTRS